MSPMCFYYSIVLSNLVLVDLNRGTLDFRKTSKSGVWNSYGSLLTHKLEVGSRWTRHFMDNQSLTRLEIKIWTQMMSYESHNNQLKCQYLPLIVCYCWNPPSWRHSAEKSRSINRFAVHQIRLTLPVRLTNQSNARSKHKARYSTFGLKWRPLRQLKLDQIIWVFQVNKLCTCLFTVIWTVQKFA